MVESGGFDISVWAIKSSDFRMEPKRAVSMSRKKKKSMDFIPKLPYLIYFMINLSLRSKSHEEYDCCG